MVRKSMWAALAVLLAYAPGTLAYEYRLSQSSVSGFTYAAELFGTGSGNSSIDYDGDGPTVTLRTVLSGAAPGTQSCNSRYHETSGCGAADSIRRGDTMEVTFRLHNAVFASNIRGSHETLTYYANSEPRDNPASMPASQQTSMFTVNPSREEGGTAGSSHVVYVLTAGQYDSQDDWGTGRGANEWAAVIDFELELPRLQGLNPSRPVTVSVEVDAGGGSNFRSSEATNVLVENDGLNGMGFTTAGEANAGLLTSRSAGSGVLRRTQPNVGATAEPTTPRTPAPLVTFGNALTFSTAGGGTSNIDIAGARTMVEGDPSQSTLATVAIGVTNTNEATGAPLQLDGQLFGIANRDDGEGDLLISVAGEFHAMGDQVWLDIDGDKMPDNSEMLELENGVMSASFSLLEVAGDASQTAETDAAEIARAQGVATRSLIFKPNGEDPLRPATYITRMSVQFDAAENRHKPEQSQMHTTQYVLREGANVVEINDRLTRHAYAIPPITSNDEGFVRVKCEAATACPVYLECDDSAGMAWFAKVDNDIDARATLQLDSETIASHLEVGEGGWTGRLSCAVMSTKMTSLQVLTRSGGALINNTFVDN